MTHSVRALIACLVLAGLLEIRSPLLKYQFTRMWPLLRMSSRGLGFPACLLRNTEQGKITTFDGELSTEPQ